MSKKLKKLEADLQELVDREFTRFDDLEEAFNLGLEFAKELNIQGITDYKNKCLDNKRNGNPPRKRLH